MTDLTACKDCTNGFDLNAGDYTVLCSNHASHIKALLQLDSIPKNISICPANIRSWLPNYLTYKGLSSIVTFHGDRLSSYLDEAQIKLLLAPAHLQKIKIEVNEFIA